MVWALLILAFCVGFFVGAVFNDIKRTNQTIANASKMLDRQIKKSTIAKRNNVVPFKQKG